MSRKLTTTTALASLLAFGLACGPEKADTNNPGDGEANDGTGASVDDERAQKAREAAEKRAMLEALPPLPGIEKPRPVKFPEAAITELPNGLKVIVLEDHEMPIANVQLIVRAGNIYADASQGPVPGLVAGLLTEGTTKRKKAKLDELIDDTGGNQGSSASDEIAQLSAEVLSGDLKTALSILSEEAQLPAFEEDSVTKMKDLAVQEVRQQKASPQALAFRMGQRVLYGDSSPYGRPFPTEDGIQAVTVEQLKAFHAKHYVPNNAMLILAGDVDGKKALAEAKKTFGKWKRGQDVAVPRSDTRPALEGAVVHVIDRGSSVQANINVVIPAPKIGEKGWLETRLLNTVLSGGTLTTRLNLVLREQLGLTYGAYSQYQYGYDGGALIAGGGTKNSSAEEFASALVDLMYEFGTTEVPAGELERIKALVSGRFALEAEGLGSTANKTVKRMLFDLPDDFWSRFRTDIDKVSAAQLLGVGKTVLERDKLQIIAVGKARRLKKALAGFGEVRVYDSDLNRIE